ncbi:MAG: tRNA (N(6)-L-threonylcarbamoyladenosine(37)-C(2))-methylthiotransferase [Halobacteriales archaeon]
MARYLLETYGCTANRGEGLRIERRLRERGHRPVDDPAEADVAILNTCTVTETTEDRMVRRARELESAVADLVVTGCLALAQPDRLADAGVDARIVGWDEVPDAVLNGECPTDGTEALLEGAVGILPIARGCASNCSYCITKRATGRIESPPIEANVERARELLEAGAVELRVTGQDTGVYGWDRGGRWLPTLLERICELPGDFRVRLGMANPKGLYLVRDELVEVFATHDELYNFVHAPVQSGSDEVLRAMRRQHTVEEFRAVVDTFDARLESWTLATDLIVGFPTETEADFAASLDLLRTVRPERINITRFSKRPGTDAAAMAGLGGTVKKERSRAMTDLKHAILAEVHADLVGRERPVLAVEPGRGDSLRCRDDAYHLIVLPNAVGVAVGDRLRVRVTDAEATYALAEPVASPARRARAGD